MKYTVLLSLGLMASSCLVSASPTEFGMSATGQSATNRVAIQTEGRFHSTGDRTSNSGIWLDPTSSFEDLNAEARTASFNLAALMGAVPSGQMHDKLTLRLRQSINGGSDVEVGTWHATLHGNVLEFSREPLLYFDGEFFCLWVLDQYRLELTGDFLPVNATLFLFSVGDTELKVTPSSIREEQQSDSANARRTRSETLEPEIWQLGLHRLVQDRSRQPHASTHRRAATNVSICA